MVAQAKMVEGSVEAKRQCGWQREALHVGSAECGPEVGGWEIGRSERGVQAPRAVARARVCRAAPPGR